MKNVTNKSSAPARLVHLGNARQQTKASFDGNKAELIHPDRLYTVGG